MAFQGKISGEYFRLKLILVKLWFDLKLIQPSELTQIVTLTESGVYKPKISSEN